MSDPAVAELHTSAQRLRSHASTLASASDRLAHATRGMAFTGPASERLRVESEQQRRRLRAAADRLSGLAASMEQESNRLMQEWTGP